MTWEKRIISMGVFLAVTHTEPGRRTCHSSATPQRYNTTYITRTCWDPHGGLEESSSLSQWPDSSVNLSLRSPLGGGWFPVTRTDSRAQFLNFFQGGLNSSKFWPLAAYFAATSYLLQFLSLLLVSWAFSGIGMVVTMGEKCFNKTEDKRS